jgi:hypothetical protein
MFETISMYAAVFTYSVVHGHVLLYNSKQENLQL